MTIMNKMQKEFLISLLKSVLMLPTLFFLYLALLPLGKDPPVVYVMLTMVDWILVALCLLGSVALDLLIAHPELRHSLTHIERHSKGAETEKKKKGELLY